MTLQRAATHGEEHPETLTSANNLAAVLRKQAELLEAARIHRATLETQKRVLGEDHPETLASAKSLAPPEWRFHGGGTGSPTPGRRKGRPVVNNLESQEAEQVGG